MLLICWYCWVWFHEIGLIMCQYACWGVIFFLLQRSFFSSGEWHNIIFCIRNFRVIIFTRFWSDQQKNDFKLTFAWMFDFRPPLKIDPSVITRNYLEFTLDFLWFPLIFMTSLIIIDYRLFWTILKGRRKSNIEAKVNLKSKNFDRIKT